MRILFLGDIVGRSGREAVLAALPRLRRQWRLDAVIANAENASGGIGLTAPNARELLAGGINVLTTGNHVWRHKNLYSVLNQEPRILRPANYPDAVDSLAGEPGGENPDFATTYNRTPGSGLGIYDINGVPVAVINLLGTTFMEWAENPFSTADRLLAAVPEHVRIRIVDFHAEATSEKKALGWYLDGRVSAVLGTHTHVQTADAMLLPNGTGYLTDAGMCGVEASVLGVEPQASIGRFLTHRPVPFKEARGQAGLNGAVLDMNEDGLCTGICIVRDTCPAAGTPGLNDIGAIADAADSAGQA